jgi:hypothetical protein
MKCCRNFLLYQSYTLTCRSMAYGMMRTMDVQYVVQQLLLQSLCQSTAGSWQLKPHTTIACL